MSLPRAFFDITADGKELGRIIFEMRVDVVPITCGHFLELCDGARGFSYQGTSFKKIISGLFCEGGHFKFHGKNPLPIYHFHNENFTLKHTGAGILSLAPEQQNKYGTEFCISFSMNEWKDNKEVVFGKVVEGFEVLMKLNAMGSESGNIGKNVIISQSGMLL